jgi:nucleolar protein 15
VVGRDRKGVGVAVLPGSKREQCKLHCKGSAGAKRVFPRPPALNCFCLSILLQLRVHSFSPNMSTAAKTKKVSSKPSSSTSTPKVKAVKAAPAPAAAPISKPESKKRKAAPVEATPAATAVSSEPPASAKKTKKAKVVEPVEVVPAKETKSKKTKSSTDAPTLAAPVSDPSTSTPPTPAPATKAGKKSKASSMTMEVQDQRSVDAQAALEDMAVEGGHDTPAPATTKKVKAGKPVSAKKTEASPKGISHVTSKIKEKKVGKTKGPIVPPPVASDDEDELVADDGAEASDDEAEAAIAESDDGSDDNVHLHGFSTDDDEDSSDDDGDAEMDAPALDVGKLPTVAKDDATVKRKLDQAKKENVFKHIISYMCNSH